MRYIDEVLNAIQDQHKEIIAEVQKLGENAFVKVTDEEFYRGLDEQYGAEPHIYSVEFLRKT